MGGGTSKPDPKKAEATTMASLIELVKSGDYKAFEKLLEENMSVLNAQDKVRTTKAGYKSHREVTELH
jgi:hypothetical protein